MSEMVGKQVPVKEGMMTLPRMDGEGVTLLGSVCNDCGEKFYIVRELCENCQSVNLEDITLSDRGRLYAFSVMYTPPPPPYIAPDPFVPFGIGWVELPEGIVIYALLTENDPQKLHAGMELGLTCDSFGKDEEGNDIVVPMFKPISGS